MGLKMEAFVVAGFTLSSFKCKKTTETHNVVES